MAHPSRTALFQRAVGLHQAGQVDAATALYRAILAEAGDDGDVLHLLGLATLQQGRPAEAEELLRRAQGKAPRNAAVDLGLGAARLALDRPAEALASLERAMARLPPTAELYRLTGNACQRLGDHKRARGCYMRALQLEPQNGAVLNDLGVLCVEAGEADAAIAYLQQAVGLGSGGAAPAYNLANAYRDAGRDADAARAYRQALAADPRHRDARFNLANLLLRQGDRAAAIAEYQQLVASDGQDAEARNNLGQALADAGAPGAEAQFRAALAVRPAFTAAAFNLGRLLQQAGRGGDAMDLYCQVLEAEPGHQPARVNLAIAQVMAGDTDAAEAAIATALAAAPDLPEAHNALGLLRHHQGRLAEARAAFAAVLARDPGHVEARSNLGAALQDLGLPDAALVEFDRVLAERPDYPEVRWNRSQVLLQLGRWSEGWREYEARFAKTQFPLPRRPFAAALWDGADLAGRSILLHAEQGLGDALQFVRFARPVAAAAGRTVVEVPAPLLTLVRRSLPEAVVVARAPDFPGVVGLPGTDLHCPLMSLPDRLGVTLETLGPQPAYLVADGARADAWRSRLAALPGRRVGLVWSGDPRPHMVNAHALDRRRSLRLAQLAPLAAVPGISFVSLQKGTPAAQAAAPPAGLSLLDLSQALVDFDDTAAVVANLDLVIAVDTSVAHLVGALGRPVWLLSRFDGCWRWLQGRDDSPWYPSLRLFRQEHPGEWAPTVDRLTEALAAWVQAEL